jgi:hypothetical protein
VTGIKYYLFALFGGCTVCHLPSLSVHRCKVARPVKETRMIRPSFAHSPLWRTLTVRAHDLDVY